MQNVHKSLNAQQMGDIPIYLRYKMIYGIYNDIYIFTIIYDTQSQIQQ